MDNYNITGEILVRAVEEYYKDDMEPMYNLLHPDVTFLLPGRDQLIEGRDELRRIMSLERSKEKLAIEYGITEISCKNYKVKNASCYSILQMEIQSLYENRNVLQVNQRIVVNWQYYRKLKYAENDYREGWFAVQVHVSLAIDTVTPVTSARHIAGAVIEKVLESEREDRVKGKRYEIRDIHSQCHYVGKNEIKYIQAESVYSWIYFESGLVIKAYKTLKEFEEELEESGFIRIHRSYLVNSLHIKTVKNYRLTLTDGSVLPISKNRYRQVKDRID